MVVVSGPEIRVRAWMLGHRAVRGADEEEKRRAEADGDSEPDWNGRAGAVSFYGHNTGRARILFDHLRCLLLRGNRELKHNVFARKTSVHRRERVQLVLQRRRVFRVQESAFGSSQLHTHDPHGAGPRTLSAVSTHRSRLGSVSPRSP